jgi:threonine dehydratase
LDIIAGQATAAKEVFEELNDLDYLVFPIGGGGLSSGCVLSTKYFGGKCKAIGV